MEVGKLTVQRRNQTGKGIARRLRAQGFIPGVCYGPMLEQPLSIAVNTRSLKASLDPVKRHNTVIHVTVEGNDQSQQNMTVMVRDYQIDKIRRELTHVDLVAIDTSKDVDVQVPIEFTGKPKGAIDGGQLHVVRHELLIRCKPLAIPAKVEVDVSHLDVGDVIHVSDLSLPAGLVAAMPGRLTVVTLAAPDGGSEAPAAAAAEGGEAAAGGDKAAAKAPAGKAAAGKAPAAKAPAADAKAKAPAKK